MPQMMPLNWLMLFMYFILMFLTFNILLYFNFLKNNKMQFKNIYKISMNWKW